MVYNERFQDILDKLSNLPYASLPPLRETCLRIEFENVRTGSVYNESLLPMPFSDSKIFQAEISNWRRLTALNENCKAIYEVTFDVTDSNFSFKAGDTVGMIPQNSESEVNTMLHHLELDALADTPYTVSVDKKQKGGKIPPHIPVESTLRHLLTYCVDIRSVMKKLFLLALSRHTKDETERKILEYVCSKEGAEAYQRYVLDRHMCVLDIFKEFKSCKPNIEVLMTNLPRLLPRPYSIVNTGLKDPKRINVCFSVFTDMENNRKGLTTGWLESMILNNDLDGNFNRLSLTNDRKKRCYGKIPIYVRKNLSGFSLPLNLEIPLMFIGTGTGVAPFIGFLEEIELAKENNPNGKFGDVHLFFGCRNPKLDYIYENELKGFLSRGVLSKLWTAFSRDDSADKYVQDLLTRNGENVTELITNNAFIFVCGDLKAMAVQVRETLIKCLMKYGKKTEEEAEQFVLDMERDKRYRVDTWT